MRYIVEYNQSFLDNLTKKLIKENFEEAYELSKGGEFFSKLYNIEDIIKEEEEHQFLPEKMWKELKIYLELLLTEKVDYIEIC